MKKVIQNTDTITYKLGPALIKITNYRLKVAKKEKQKREKIVDKQKVEVIGIKRYRKRI